jgi:hypothetical protein
VWSEEGRKAMLKTAKTNPTVFLATCSRLMGPEVKLTIEQSLPAGLLADDWSLMREIVEAVRQAMPDASSQPPSAVLNHVLSALRMSNANVLDCSKNMRSSDSSICSSKKAE